MPIVSHHRQHAFRHDAREPRRLVSAVHFLWVLWCTHVTQEMGFYAVKSIRDLVFMAVELLTENTMIQVISSLEHNRTPLRDVAEEFLMNSHNQALVNLAYFGKNTYQVDTNSVLFLWVFYCFLHGPRGLAVLQKGVRCLTIARALRIVTFSITVLPNPNPMCNFTGPIDPWNLSPGGACNDLLYSGHVIVYTISALAVTILCSSYPCRPFRVFLRFFIWVQVVQRMIRAIVELHHYSVDMVLGLCVTLLTWHADVLYGDLPVLPTPLYPHLKRLLFPHDSHGLIDQCLDQLMFIYRRFKRQPMKTVTAFITNHAGLLPSQIHMKQV